MPRTKNNNNNLRKGERERFKQMRDFRGNKKSFWKDIK